MLRACRTPLLAVVYGAFLPKSENPTVLTFPSRFAVGFSFSATLSPRCVDEPALVELGRRKGSDWDKGLVTRIGRSATHTYAATLGATGFV